MKNLFKTTAILMALTIGMVSCEKEETNYAQDENIQNIKLKKTSNTKSSDFPEDYWDDVQQFIYNVMENEDLSDMEINKALYYTESTLDWRLVHSEDNEYDYRDMDNDLFYTITYSEIDDIDQLSEETISKINADIYADVEDEATARAQNDDREVVVDDIDIDWEINTSTNEVYVYVSVLYGYLFPSPPSSFTCATTWYDCKAAVNEKCDNTPYRNAAQEVDRYLAIFCCYNNTSSYCIWDRKLSCNLSNHILVNHQTQSGLRMNTPFSFLWGGYSSQFNDCRTTSDHQNYLTNIRYNWQYQNGVNQIDRLRKVAVYLVNPTDPTSRQHGVSYRTVVCKEVCDGPYGCPAILRPEPSFN